jgi:hypothetical protein
LQNHIWVPSLFPDVSGEAVESEVDRRSRVVCTDWPGNFSGVGFLQRFYSMAADFFKWDYKCGYYKNILSVQIFGCLDLELAL